MFNFGTQANPPKTGTVPNPISSAVAPASGTLQSNLGQTAGSGDNKPGSTWFASTLAPGSSTLSTGLGANLNQPKQTVAPTLSFGAPATTIGGQNSGFGAEYSMPAPAANTSVGMSFAFGAPASTSVASSAASTLSFGLAAPASTSAPTLSFGFGAPATSTSAPSLSFGFGGAAGTTTTSTATFTPILSSTATTASSSLATSGLKFGTTSTATTAIAPTSTTPAGFSLGGTAASGTVATTQSSSTTAAAPATGTLTFVQLEDSINKWTIDLEEQGKFFINQAKQLNAWDGLLISNGEKILNLNSNIEKVKQQQSQLDQELDFILAQQKELEELIVPLEKELVDIPAVDIDRNQMYQFSEIIDYQLKQISEDLKEIIESINESNKDEEISNPITQISKILNAHMNSLQWIDTNTAQINRRLDEIVKIEETNRRNLSANNSFSLHK